MRVVVGLFGLASTVVLAGCQRAAPEEFLSRPPSPSASALLAGGGDGGGATSSVAAASTEVAPAEPRCLRPTPTRAPTAAPPGPAAGCPPDPLAAPPVLPTRTVSFLDASGHELATIDAEIAVSAAESERGLMYRRSMPEMHGMWFDLGRRADHQFWMHNSCISLDLVYVDADGFIVGIVENAPTLDDSSLGVGCLSRYVVEVNAGWTRRHGVRAGQRVRVP